MYIDEKNKAKVNEYYISERSTEKQQSNKRVIFSRMVQKEISQKDISEDRNLWHPTDQVFERKKNVPSISVKNEMLQTNFEES